MTESSPQTDGTIKPEFIKKHNLNPNTLPEAYTDIFLPFSKNMQQGKEMISFKQLTRWTNKKAILAGAGRGGTIYKDFVPFTVKEVRQHISLYILQGLQPLLRIGLKFKP